MATDKFLTDFFMSSIAEKETPMEWDISFSAKCRQIPKQNVLQTVNSSLSSLSCQQIEPCLISPEVTLADNKALSCDSISVSSEKESKVDTLAAVAIIKEIVKPISIVSSQVTTESKMAEYAPSLADRYFPSQESKLRFYFNHLLTLSGLSAEQTSSVARYLSRMDISNLVEVAKEHPVQLYSNDKGAKFLTKNHAKLGINPVVFVSD